MELMTGGTVREVPRRPPAGSSDRGGPHIRSPPNSRLTCLPGRGGRRLVAVAASLRSAVMRLALWR